MEGITWTWKLTDYFPLESSTLDVPYKATSCRKKKLCRQGEGRTLSHLLRNWPGFWSKVFVVTDDYQWAISFYMLDPCEPMRESFNFCAKSNVTCGVYFIVHDAYAP
jgi:hypothetical protein